MNKGLVVGKFCPPHRGHEYLISEAMRQSDSVDVLVCDNPEYAIDAQVRAGWLRALFPEANVLVIPDLEDDENSEGWAKHTMDFLGYAPDTVFTSEDYGQAYAKYMHAQHVEVDKERHHVPICATDIRADVLGNWQYLSPIVRAHFARRFCVIGAESTGTTTLSKALAEHYHTFWVPEYGRYYTDAKLTAGESVDWSSDEFTFIAQEQQHFEDQLAGQSPGMLICDTNAFATKIWHERYMGEHVSNKALAELAGACMVDAYIVTAPDIPFEQDGTRDGNAIIRGKMHERFINEIAESHIPFTTASGSLSSRLKTATNIIDTLMQQKVVIT